MVIRGEQALPAQPNFNVIQVTANDNYTKLLVNSDRYLRLYQVHYPTSKSDSGRFELLDTFQDVINHKRWLHSYFIRLNDQTKIISQPAVNEGQPSLFTPQQVIKGEN